MQFLFSRKCLTLLGIGALIFSVAFWKTYKTEAQQLSGSTSASAGWWSTSASVTPSFNDDPELYEIGTIWRGRGTARVSIVHAGPTKAKVDSCAIYVKIKEEERTTSRGVDFSDPEFGITWYSSSRLTTRKYNYAYCKGRSASLTWPGKRGKHASAAGEFPSGITLPHAWDTYY